MSDVRSELSDLKKAKIRTMKATDDESCNYYRHEDEPENDNRRNEAWATAHYTALHVALSNLL